MARLAPCYANGTTDRAVAHRRDEGWLSERLADPRTKLVAFWRGRYPIDAHDPDRPRVLLIARSDPRSGAMLAASPVSVFLGVHETDALFAVDLSDLEEVEARALVDGGSLVDLREVGALLAAREAGLMAYAAGILQWHRRHRFCGVCGHPTDARDGGHLRKCTVCNQQIFPRIDPAVIMLVEHRPTDGGPARCLLAHHGRLRANVYSVIAGFVEPGESLEAAVAREVREEVGCEVDEVVYQASQPWPFPASLMIGFFARSRGTELEVDGEELLDARWFTAAELRASDGKGAPILPREDSIARSLIERWLELQTSSDPTL